MTERTNNRRRIPGDRPDRRSPGQRGPGDGRGSPLRGRNPESFHNSIWARQREHGQRGQPSLSYESIVQAAIELADTEGSRALSMRGLASKLGVGTMSLYWYVPSKDDLLDLVVDSVRGEIEVPDPATGDWRTNISTLARNTRQVMLRHHWMVNLAAAGHPVGPHTLRMADSALAFFDQTGADPMTVVSSWMSIDTFVMGFVMREQQEQVTHQYEEQLSPDEFKDLANSYHVHLEGYPHIQGLIRAGVDPDSPDSRDERFEFGLECLLDGIATRLTHSRRHPVA